MRYKKSWIRNPSDELAVSRGCYFDERRGARAVGFLEKFCRQSKGRWGGEPLKLLGWERDLILRLFGWRRADERRRFKSVYVEVPKKNGKSTLVSALVLLLDVADGEQAPEIYINACDRDQASIIFDETKRMIENSPAFLNRFEVVDSRKIILDPVNKGKIRANSADVAKHDGVNASHVIWDELHRQKDRELWKIFQYAGITREQFLRIVITTAGETETGPWFEQREYSKRVNAGTVEDIHHLGVIYAIEEGEDVEDPKVWKRVNPSMGELFTVDDFALDFQKAKEEGSDEVANFLRLRLGRVGGRSTSFVDLETWDRLALPVLPAGDRPAYLGLDLSSVDDLTAAVRLVGDEEGGFDVVCRFFLPEALAGDLQRKHKAPYLRWAEEGWVDLTPGEVVDYGYVRTVVRDQFLTGVNIRKVVSDPFNAYKLAIELRDDDSLPVEFLRQGYLSLSPPTKDLLRLIRSGKIRHGGNPVLRWMIDNARVEQDAAGNIKLSKHKSRGKIDGMAALINALAGSTIKTGDGMERSVYEDRGVLVLEVTQ
jgi:phage terminase large subunit-like protein